MQNDLNEELKNYNESIDTIHQSLELKVETKELTPIWKHFERFALYEDLKDLYNIVIPKIANFE